MTYGSNTPSTAQDRLNLLGTYGTASIMPRLRLLKNPASPRIPHVSLNVFRDYAGYTVKETSLYKGVLPELFE